ncbi:hypothetical protein [Nannocystis bainbridge]|uniref:Uncharacterized protein n=1 Tax=Nannocystis bainbridge TaxID=2995303 RepID=A0ABT5E9V9_9BACT|nr:hypothetical protein [Nannocystis bainbridge]MDC0721561.1 hypothetical protein [Nannocystis bainbridge]
MTDLRFRLLLCSFVGSGFACEHGGEPDFFVISGDHVDYRYSRGMEPCAGNAFAVNAFALHTALVLGLDRDNEELPRITFSWLTDEDFELWTNDTCVEAKGCSIGTEAYSHIPIHHHEVVHALMPPGAPFLDEGLAVALDPGSGGSLAEIDERDPRPYLVDFVQGDLGLTDEAYGVAGLFVSYLLQVYGAERFHAVYAAIPRKSEFPDWQSAFLQHYDRSADELAEEYLSAKACPKGISPLPRFECSAPEIVPQDGMVVFQRTLDCSDEDVEGGVSLALIDEARPGWGVRVSRSFVIDTPGEYKVVVVTPTTEDGTVGYALLGPCGGCAWLPEPGIAITGNSEGEVMWLDEGQFFVTVSVPETVAQEVSVSISPAP